MMRQISVALCAALAISVAGCTDGPVGPVGDLGVRDLSSRPVDMTDLTAIDPLAGLVPHHHRQPAMKAMAG